MPTRVLIVDDSLVVAKQLKSALGDSSAFEIVGHARNGAHALKLFADQRPDLVLLDLVMPIMDGMQALRALRGIDPDVRVLVISSMGGVEAKVTEALRLGAKGVVTKPIEAEEVVRAVGKVMGEID